MKGACSSRCAATKAAGGVRAPAATAWSARRSVRESPSAGAGSSSSNRAGGRALGDGTTGAPSGRRRRAHTSRRLRCSTTARGGSLHRRRLVLPSPLCARAGQDEAPRDWGRYTTSPAASARRQPALRTTPAAADGNRRTDTARPSRPSRTARHRPLDRRHPHHARQRLAMGPHRTEARSTISTLAEFGSKPAHNANARAGFSTWLPLSRQLGPLRPTR